MEIHDFSARRGALVPYFSQIHAMIKENALRDRFGNLQPPEHLVTWQHKMRKELVDINRRFVVALDGGQLTGVLFYRVDGTDIYIEDIQVAWAHRNNPAIIDGFLKRLEHDQTAGAKGAVFYASERIKIDMDTEKLVARGHKVERVDGWEQLGTLAQTAAALKIRYNRGV